MAQEPMEITAGDHVKWSVYDPEHLPDDGWELRYAIRGPAAIDLISTPDASSHNIDIPGATSAAYAAGSYSWARYFRKADGTRETACTGRLTVRPDLVSAVAGFDGSTHAERTLAAIERVIEGRASKGDWETEIDGIRIKKMTVEELIRLRQYYRNEVRVQQAKQRGKTGRKTGRIIKFRM